jgi:two-component system, NarL family, invasion response regulator UvrY
MPTAGARLPARSEIDDMNILIADDHLIVRHGLRHIIASQPGWSVVAEASTADEVLPLLRRETIDILVLDVTLEGRSGIDLLGSIRSEFPKVPVLMLSMHDEEQYALRCLRAGASGYIEKRGSAEELIRAIQRVADGHIYVSSAVADQLADELRHGTAALPHERLSAREFEVFRQIAAGKSIAEIAGALHLSASTVSTYRSRIIGKTGFHSNADIINYAIRNGLV